MRFERKSRAGGQLPSGVELNPFVRQSRPGDVAAQLLQPPGVVCLDPDRSMQAEAVDVGAERLTRCGLARHHAPERQHLLPGSRAEGDAVSDGRGLQRARLLTVNVDVGVGQVGLAHLLD